MVNDYLVEGYRKNVDLIRNIAVDQLNLSKVHSELNQVTLPLNDLIGTRYLEQVIGFLRETLLILNESRLKLEELLWESRELTSDDLSNLNLRILLKTWEREVDDVFKRVNEQLSIYLTNYLKELNLASKDLPPHAGYNFEQLSWGEKLLLKVKDRVSFWVFLKGFFEFLSQQHGLDLSENVKLVEGMETDHKKLQLFVNQTISLNLALHRVAFWRRSSLSYQLSRYGYLTLLFLIVLFCIIVLLEVYRGC